MFFISGPESETTTSIHPHQQKISSKMNCTIGSAAAEDKVLASTHPEAFSWVTIR